MTSLRVQEDARHRGGFALVYIDKPAPQAVLDILIWRAGSDQSWLGSSGWQPSRFTLNGITATSNSNSCTLSLGPHIVDHLEEDTLVKLIVPALGIEEEIFWPYITPSGRSSRQTTITGAAASIVEAAAPRMPVSRPATIPLAPLVPPSIAPQEPEPRAQISLAENRIESDILRKPEQMSVSENFPTQATASGRKFSALSTALFLGILILALGVGAYFYTGHDLKTLLFASGSSTPPQSSMPTPPSPSTRVGTAPPPVTQPRPQSSTPVVPPLPSAQATPLPTATTSTPQVPVTAPTPTPPLPTPNSDSPNNFPPLPTAPSTARVEPSAQSPPALPNHARQKLKNLIRQGNADEVFAFAKLLLDAGERSLAFEAMDYARSKKHAGALLQFGRWYDPRYQSENMLFFREDIARSVSYYDEAVAAGSQEAKTELRGLCKMISNLTDQSVRLSAEQIEKIRMACRR